MRNAERFGAKFADSIVTTLTCVDRLIFKGYLPFGGDQQLKQFVDRLGIRRKDFLPQLEPLAERSVEYAKAAATQGGAPYQYLQGQHSKEQIIDMTMNVYTDPKLLDVHGALDSLPELPLPCNPQQDRIDVNATGTDNSWPRPFVPGFAPTADYPSKSGSFVAKSGDPGLTPRQSSPLGISPCQSTKKGPLSTLDNGPSRRGRRGSNPQPPDRQSGTLTN